MPLPSRSVPVALLAIASITAGACGGSKTAPSSPASGGTAQQTDSSSKNLKTAAPRSRCEGGTCVECGEGLCPTGFFCDEGGLVDVCSWLPQCPAEPTCECVREALGSGCDCDVHGGGVHVACD